MSIGQRDDILSVALVLAFVDQVCLHVKNAVAVVGPIGCGCDSIATLGSE